MPSVSPAFALVCVVAIGCNFTYANERQRDTLVNDYIDNGVSHVIDKCSGNSWPLKCPHGKFLRAGKKDTFVDNNSGKKLSFQKLWYEGMNFSYRQDDIVSLSIYSSKWPAYRGLGIGTPRERVLAVLGKPIDDEPSQSSFAYCKVTIEDCVYFEFGLDGLASKITWSFYYD